MDVTVLQRGDGAYEEARRAAIWNGKKPDRFPDAIALAEREEHVVEAVRLAAERDWQIGVRAGGHSWSANAVRNGGLLLDVSRLDQIDLDLDSRTAAIGPGVRGPDLQWPLNENGLYFPTGACPGVGVAGYILGGGVSFTGRRDGPAAYCLRGIEVVTGDGEKLYCDDENDPDVIWAARGAGPDFFAAVTRFDLEVKPLPAAMYGGVYIYPEEVIDEFLDWNLGRLDQMPPETGSMWMAIESTLPEYKGTTLVHFPIVAAESTEEALALLEPFESSPLLDSALLHEPPHPWRFPDGYRTVDEIYVTGNRYRADALWMKPDSAGLKEALKEVIGSLPNRWSHVLWSPWIPREHPNAAFSLQTGLSVHPYGVCQDPAEDAAMADYVDRAIQLLLPHSNGGGKVNDCDLAAFPKDVLSAENAARLERVRERYDPGERFYRALTAGAVGY